MAAVGNPASAEDVTCKGGDVLCYVQHEANDELVACLICVVLVVTWWDTETNQCFI